MSHFYADIEGNRGVATRGGTKNSGIDGHIRGWDTGAQVFVSHDKETGKDIVQIYRTRGSEGGRRELIAEWGKDYYKPVKRICENILRGVECETCVNRFKCFTERG